MFGHSIDWTSQESAVKILQIGDNALLGCAGYDDKIDLYEGVAEKHIRPKTRDFEQALAKADLEYKREVYAEWRAGEYEKGASLPDECFTEALLCASDAKTPRLL